MTRHGAMRCCAALACLALAAGAAGGAAPAWWRSRGVVVAGAALTNDYAAINQGQLKWLAAQAAAELDANLRNGAGPEVTALVAAFSREDLYSPVNLGQLKRVARPLYDRLIAEGCAAGYPWTASTADDLDFALANIGQAKHAFSFNLDADENGLPDWWEAENAQILGLPGDLDGDSLAAAAEYRAGTDLLNIDSDGDGIDDARDAHPRDAGDTDADGLADDWERFWFGSLDASGGDDPDGDGRPNLLEFTDLTPPTLPDAADAALRTQLDVFRPTTP